MTVQTFSMTFFWIVGNTFFDDPQKHPKHIDAGVHDRRDHRPGRREDVLDNRCRRANDVGNPAHIVADDTDNSADLGPNPVKDGLDDWGDGGDHRPKGRDRAGNDGGCLPDHCADRADDGGQHRQHGRQHLLHRTDDAGDGGHDAGGNRAKR